MGRIRGIAWLASAAVVIAVIGATAVGCDDETNGALGGFTLPDGGGIVFGEAGTTDVVIPGTDSGLLPIDPSVGLPPGTSVDLGLGDCGSTVTKTLEFTNVGGKELLVALEATAPFTISPAAVNVQPGGKGSVTLSVAVPSSSTAGTAITGSVNITTNDPKKTKVTVPATITPAGATLLYQPASLQKADFGTVKNGVTAPNITLSLINAGNKGATFAWGAPGDAQFTVASTPASPATLAPNATVTVLAGFTPNKLTQSTSVSNITATGAVCGASVTKIDFSGQGSTSNVNGWPSAALDFGSSPCGGAKANTQKFTLTNTGSADATITAVTLGTKGYTASIAAGAKVPQGGTLDVIITPPSVPTPSLVPGSYGDTLAFTTDVPNDTPHNVDVKLAASGAILAIDTSATANFSAFGQVPVGSTATHAFAVKNTGNTAASVTASAGGGPFGTNPATAFNVPAGGSTSADATFSPTNTSPQIGSLSLSAVGLCQPLPTALPLNGTGTAGGIEISDNSLSFQTNCGTQAAQKTFLLTNSGNVTMTWSAVLGKGVSSPYTISPKTATAPPGSVIGVIVTPNPIPQTPPSIAPSAFADVITITTDIVGDNPHTVTLSEIPIGAVLSIAPSPQNAEPQMDFGNVPINTTVKKSYTVTNTGNPGSDAVITVSADPPVCPPTDARIGCTATYAIETPQPSAANPGSPFTTNVVYNPGSSNTPSTSLIKLQTNAPLCAPLPIAPGAGKIAGELTAAGTGTSAYAYITINQRVDLNFGQTACGTTAQPIPVHAYNFGNQAYTITSAVLQFGTWYTLSFTCVTECTGQPSNVVNPFGEVLVTVTPKAMSATVAVPPDSATYQDQLSITTDAQNDLGNPHTFPITQGAYGAVLSALKTNTWDFGPILNQTTSTFNSSITNDGNADVLVSINPDPLAVSEFAFSAGQNVYAGASNPISATFTPLKPGPYTTPGTLVITGPLCQPVPNYAITLMGSSYLLQ